MIRLADYVMQRIADAGVTHVFLVTGGGAMHLNDALGREPRISYVCNHHEQACAMAAESYARLTNSLGVVSVTTGPGGINALNGVFGAWTDSIPLLVISGQVKRETCKAFYDGLQDLRQLGDQEGDLIDMAKPITKYIALVREPEEIRYQLEKAIHLATTGRPGPCWLDIPVDVQSARIDPDALRGYDPAENGPGYDMLLVEEQCRETLRRLRAAERPVMMLGTGLRIAGAEAILDTVSKNLGIPVTTAWTAHDLLDANDPLNCGRPGTIGDRAGNFTVQNSDVLLVVGCRLHVRQISYNWPAFARHAYKIQVDADAAELNKPTVKPELGIHCDARLFLETLNDLIDTEGWDTAKSADWLAWCRDRVARYPVVQAHHRVFNGYINPYQFIETLSEKLTHDDVMVCGDGAACVVTFQAAAIKKGQRLYCNSGDASMGYDLPAAIGAAVARDGKRVICFAGDGSIQMNLQELQTMVHHQFPIKLFVLNNGGYLSIRTTQQNFFKGNFVGEGPRSGVSFPDMVKLAQAYGLHSIRLDSPDWASYLDAVLASPGPVLCEVMLDPEQQFEPKLSSKVLPDGRMVSAPLEDLFPFLDRDELLSNLLVPPMEY